MRAIPMVMLALCGTLAACGPGEKARTATPPQPPAAALRTFAACSWGEVRGATLSMWSFSCGADAGGVHVVADEGLPGFAIESTDPRQGERRVAVRVFDKPAGAPIEEILGAVRALSPGLQTPECVFAPAGGVDHAGKGHFVFTPSGAAKTAYDAAVAGDEQPSPPCGPLGISPVGDRYFAPVPGRTDKVMFVDRGSEIQIFDETTLRVIGR